MNDEDRRALGQTRRLVFQNLANGVPIEQVMVDFRLSQLEVDRARQFVARKITEYRVFERQPPIACADVREIRWNRRALLGVLARIGNMSLSTDVILFRDKSTGELTKVSYGKITTQALDHPEMIEGAKHRMDETYR